MRCLQSGSRSGHRAFKGSIGDYCAKVIKTHSRNSDGLSFNQVTVKGLVQSHDNRLGAQHPPCRYNDG
jgi:hypothetical protein